MIDEEKDIFDQSEETSGLKVWFEDNLRILLSILVVIAIAGGIYSYSKRAQAPEVTQTAATEQTEDKTTGSTESTPATTETENAQQTPEDTTKNTQQPAATSSETTEAFTVTAVKGQGETHLARQALADFLSKNPDSQLSKEHKIYIEDYLRKKNSFVGHVRVGTSVEFQKNLIQQAITQAKTLNERQLNHLKIYSARVTNLP